MPDSLHPARRALPWAGASRPGRFGPQACSSAGCLAAPTPDGATPVFFLTQGDRVYDVHVGDELDKVYHVDGLNNGQLVFTYKPLNVQQSITITGVAP